MIGAKFESREPMFYRGFIIVLTVLVGGLIWSNSVDPSNAIDISNSTEKVSPAITTSSSPQKIKFAKFLSDNNIKMFSAYWCPHSMIKNNYLEKKQLKS